MKPLISAVLALAAVSLASTAAAAQYANPYGVVAGSRVRVVAPSLGDQPLVGRLVAAGGDSLVLLASASAATTRMPIAAVQGIAVSDGRDRAASALQFGAVGALIGGVTTAVAIREEAPWASFVGFIAGALAGAPVGALAGALVAPERWRELFVEPSVSPAPVSGEAGYRLTVPPGTPVRLARRASPERLTETIVDEVSGDTLRLGARGLDDLHRVPLADLARLEVRGGKDRRRGILYGAAAFGVGTGIAGGIDYSHHEISAGDLIGTTIGNMVVGGLLGYALAPVGWEPLALPRR